MKLRLFREEVRAKIEALRNGLFTKVSMLKSEELLSGKFGVKFLVG